MTFRRVWFLSNPRARGRCALCGAPATGWDNHANLSCCEKCTIEGDRQRDPCGCVFLQRQRELVEEIPVRQDKKSKVVAFPRSAHA